MTLHLTAEQSALAVAVCDLSSNGPTSVRDVAREVGHNSPSTTHCVLLRLRHLGVVRWEDGRTRTLAMSNGVTMIQGQPYYAAKVLP